MQFSLDTLLKMLKLGAGAKRDAGASVRVSVYVDATATPFLVQTVREALVPQTTSGLVRVERLTATPATPKPDTDIVLVLSCGSDYLQAAVQGLVVSGTPVVVIAESSVEVPFITEDTPLLGLVAATDADYLLSTLATWIVSHTEKADAFAANFSFIRPVVVRDVVEHAALTNTVTGALLFTPGADYPVLTLTQAGMALRLASVHGYRLSAERAYEVATVAVAGLALRGCSRVLCRQVPRGAFLVKGIVAGAGTYGMGLALDALYRHGVDYSAVNAAVSRATGHVRAAVRPTDQSPR
ncbi:hypothetical protein [Collinsella sp. An2]|uniref:hypothetical protein n=1 Tax=Collinsella sp. An2 TaxID=1965585 RepID=UPI000B3794E3|nr:hypothetical protein [Collinsella sp. An2]OUP08262.1 hypothetical protein B5F33_07575 [Collinsella sp. An2]